MYNYEVASDDVTKMGLTEFIMSKLKFTFRRGVKRRKPFLWLTYFLAWGDFHARSRFAGSTIPEGKWGTTRSLQSGQHILKISKFPFCKEDKELKKLITIERRPIWMVTPYNFVHRHKIYSTIRFFPAASRGHFSACSEGSGTLLAGNSILYCCVSCKKWRIQGRRPGAPPPLPHPPLFLDRTEAQRAERNFFLHQPLLSQGLDDRPSPPALSEGLDPPRHSAPGHENIQLFINIIYLFIFP